MAEIKQTPAELKTYLQTQRYKRKDGTVVTKTYQQRYLYEKRVRDKHNKTWRRTARISLRKQIASIDDTKLLKKLMKIIDEHKEATPDSNSNSDSDSSED
jgi:hypothetical protein